MSFRQEDMQWAIHGLQSLSPQEKQQMMPGILWMSVFLVGFVVVSKIIEKVTNTNSSYTKKAALKDTLVILLLAPLFVLIPFVLIWGTVMGWQYVDKTMLLLAALPLFLIFQSLARWRRNQQKRNIGPLEQR